MSKIGNFNIAMTERVNELGYDTVEEAIADGWDSNEFYESYMEEARSEQEKAHNAWLADKTKVMSNLSKDAARLLMFAKISEDERQAAWIEHIADDLVEAVNFIDKGEC